MCKLQMRMLALCIETGKLAVSKSSWKEAAMTGAFPGLFDFVFIKCPQKNCWLMFHSAGGEVLMLKIGLLHGC